MLPEEMTTGELIGRIVERIVYFVGWGLIAWRLYLIDVWLAAGFVMFSAFYINIIKEMCE